MALLIVTVAMTVLSAAYGAALWTAHSLLDALGLGWVLYVAVPAPILAWGTILVYGSIKSRKGFY